MKKRILSILLAVLMLLSALPLGMVDTAYAAALASGKCGDSATWTLDNTGTLTISGTGATYNYDMDDDGNSAAPWCTKARIQRVNKVVVNSGITELGYSMFSNCTQLTSVSLPSGLKRIGSCLFLGCTRLSAITIPSSVTTIESNAFTHCDSITAITLPGGLRTMGDAVCSQMAKLTTATVSGGVTYLSNYAFNDCPSLKTITLPNTVRSIGICAFRYDTALKDVYFNGSVTQWTSIQIAGEGNSALYNADVHCTGLPAPTVTGGNDSQGRPTLKWNAVSGAAKYEVYRARSRSGEYIKYSTVTGTSYTNTSYIENGNTYYYKVRALDANGTAGAWSSIVSVTYKQTLPAPIVTGGNDSQGRPTLKWNAVSGAAKYEVYRARSLNGDYIKYSTVTGTSYTNTSYIENGNTYYYKVRALDANGTAGAWSSIVSVTYKQTLSAPTVTGGNDAQGRPTLTWKVVTGAAKYEVYRARSRSGEYIKYSTVTGTSYTNISYIENGNTYYYKVRALDANGTAGAWSSVVSVTYKQTLSAPTVTGGNDSQGRPTLKWNAVTGAAKYEVYRARSRSGEYIKYSTVTGTSYTNTSYIENGNTYYYKVRALKSDGAAGAWSSIVSVTYKQTLPAPTVTGGNDAQGRPTLKWNAVTGAAKYEVYRARSMNGDYIKYSTVTGTSYTNTSYIEDGNTYYYKVRALKSDGTAGAWSSIVSVTYKQTLSAPSVTGGNDAQGRPTLKWKAVTGAAKYEVYRARSKDGDYIKYSTVTGTSYTNISYIENGNTYYYKVRALKSDGTAGAWSSIVSVTYRKPAAATVASGKCGDSAAWKLDAAGTLTISGSGKTWDFIDEDWNANAPWYDVSLRLRIKKVVVEKGITYVGTWAFYDCSEMTSVSLPTTLETMGADVFMYCTGLTSVTIPDGVTFISGDFFRGCTSLKSVTLPDSLRETGGCTFMYCTSLTSVRLPATLLSISWQMFKDCKSLTSLTIPRSVVDVKQDAFSGCTALKNVTYTGTTADWKALTIYSGNEALTRANVRCTGSTVLTAPTLTLSVSKKGQPTLKWSAVSGAAGYQLWCSYDSGDGTGPWYHWLTNLDKGTASFTDDRELEKGRTYTYKVRAVTSSGAVGSFSKEVTFTYNPAASLAAPTVTAGLDDQGYPALTWPAVPDAARYEVYRAASEDGNFAQLAAITSNSYTNSAVLTDGAAYYYKVRALDSDGEAGPFSDVVSVTYTARPALVASGKCGDSASWKLDADGVLTITGAGPMADYGQHASDNCAPWRTYANDIKKVVVQKGVTAIGSYAFASLERVTSVTIPEGVTSIGSSAFENCGLMAYGGLGAVTLPEGLTTIGSSAFSGSYMDSLTLPESLRTIGGAAFEKSHLKTLTIPGGVTSIGNGAFKSSHLTSIQLPDGAQLGAMLFYQCYELTDVTLPADLTVIGDSMFENCTKLTHVTIPSGVTRIEREAFAMCGALEEIRLPEGVETIGVIAFSGCVAMTGAYLPRSLTTIESGAFSACRSLTDVYYGGTAAEWLAISVADRNDPLLNAALHCTGSALVASGKCGDSASWKLDADGVLTITGAGPMADYGAYGPWYIAHLTDIKKVVVQEGVTTIGDHAFANLSYVTSVTIPSSITSIGAHAFEKCRLGGAVTLPEGLTAIGDFAFSGSGMASLTLPESLRTIGNSAFLFCSLRELTIPDGVTSIGTGAFYNASLTSVKLPASGVTLGDSLFQECENLTDVTLPADLTVIGPSMFENCGSLKNVTIPSGVTHIGNAAFAACEALPEIRLPDGMEALGSEAFVGCRAVTKVYIPRSLTSIGEAAFRICEGLTDVYYGGTAAEWAAISVADRNDPLLNAALHCTGQSASRLDVPAMTLGEDCSDGKPTVWWPAVTGAERYEIWRAQAASDGSAPAASAYTLIVSADVTFHKDTTAEADTWYYYKVRAVSGSTYSDFSQAARRYCEAPPTMDTPEITSLELDDSGKPVLTWRTVEGAARYQVFRSEDNGFSYSPMGTVLPTGSDTITWTDTTAVSGTGYYYGVGCYDDNGHYSSFGGGEWWVTAR
ncbi:MAG: leucine-rich repeat protein [Oscillospiraceae bacterium]